MALRVVTPPAASLVTLSAAKEHLHLDAIDEDPLVRDLIEVATERVEAFTQRRYLTQVLEWVLPCWRAELRLPVAPVQSVHSITYIDSAGAAQTLAPSAYVVSPSGQTKAIRPRSGATWPALDPDATEAVVVRFTAGAASAPASARQAALLWIGALHADREAPEPPPVAGLLMDETWS
jgi:uncharacterized phiE125 gp8 family phage protein